MLYLSSLHTVLMLYAFVYILRSPLAKLAKSSPLTNKCRRFVPFVYFARIDHLDNMAYFVNSSCFY